MKINMIFFTITAHSLLRMKKNLILCFSFLLINTLYSQRNKFQEIKTNKESEHYKISEITQDKFNNIWLATNKGLLKFDGIKSTPFVFNVQKQSQKVNSIFKTNDSLFIGTSKSLKLKTHNNFFTFEANGVHKIYKHKQQYFIASNQGMLHFKNNLLKPLKISYNLDFSVINDIIYHENNYIIASNSGLWTVKNLIQPKKTVRISKGNYTSLLQIKKKLYVVKNNVNIEKLNTNNELIEKYTRSKIVNISHINNKIYVATKNEGIDVLNSASFIFEKRINKYNSSLKSNAITAVFEDTEKNVFIATDEELYIKKNSSTQRKPSLKIVNLEVNYIAIDTINVNTYAPVLQLKPNQNNISFLLQSVSISHPENIEFRYKLNHNFSLWNANKQINFASLKPGKYEFIAESRFKDNKEITSKEFLFFIAMPIYQKGWFLMICSIAFCLILIVIIEFYIRKLKTKNKQKIAALKLENHLLSLEQKALQLQMNPHFIFNALNGIKALGNSDNKQELNKAITQFSILLRSLLNNSRLEEISLKEEIETLENYVSLEQRMSSKKFEFSFEKNLNSMDAEEILIPPMLIQPFIENAIKHGVSKIASVGKISVLFKLKHRFLECTILDNGIGIFQSQKGKINKNHTSVALKVTKERIENLSKFNSFCIEEIKKENTILGTRIWFKIPLKTDY
jgi:hypothetical protein